jgi:hypothetical protein
MSHTSLISRRPRVSGRLDAPELRAGSQQFQTASFILSILAIHLTHDSCLGLADIEGEGAPNVALNGLFRLLVHFGG